VVLKFCARVDTYCTYNNYYYNETLIDNASKLNITFLLEVKNIILFTVTSTKRRHLTSGYIINMNNNYTLFKDELDCFY